MKEIPLPSGRVALVDDEDYAELAQYKWHTCGGYVARDDRERKDVTILMHRDIMKPPPGMRVDHKDWDTLNNQRANLRICTSGQNNHHKHKKPGCSSKYIGVSWYKRNRRWLAYVKKDRRMVALGYFDNEDDAARAHDDAARDLWGEFSMTNF